jgi:type I restriction enzyme S subunit
MTSQSGWKYLKLSELFDEVSEKNHPDADVLTIIQGVGTVLRTDSGRDILYDKNSLSNYKFVKKGDFIIHLRSFEGGLEIANQDGIVSPAYIILRPKVPTATTYLYTVFHSNRFINQTMAPAVEGVRDGRSVKYEVLKERSIPFPPLAEQQKIAQILTKQDELISLKEKLLEQKQQQKKWLMQKLLEVPHKNRECTEKLSINNVVIDKSRWKKEYLGNMCTSITSGGHIINSDNGKYPIYGSTGKIGMSESFAYDEELILIARVGANAGSVYVINGKSSVSDNTLIVIPNLSIDFTFAYWLLCFENLSKLTFGTGQPLVTSTQVKNITFFLPTLPEQKIIAQVLSAADKEIDLLKQEIELQKQKKKALAQQLLFGKARVKT